METNKETADAEQPLELRCNFLTKSYPAEDDADFEEVMYFSEWGPEKQT